MTTRTVLLAGSLASALLLGACGTKERGLESIHQPVVARADYAFDVATGGGGLAPGEDRRLAGWMESLRLGYGDRVAIDAPGPNAGVRDDVAREVSRYGLLVSDEVPLTEGTVAPGMARVVVSRTRATVPGCPDFSHTRGPEFEGATGSNHGCAVNANLAAMIANPMDLVRGQTGRGVNDPATSGKAIELYRKAAPTGGGGTAVKSDAGGK